jgi:nucleoside-diphosphate-sugar epimerase
VQIVGTGFMSKSFEALKAEHPDVLLFGAGVSHSLCEDPAEFRREADLLYSALRYCKERGMLLIYFSSTGMVYGTYEAEVREDGPVFPRTSYGRHKLAFETVIRSAGVRHLILRLSNPVGAGQRAHQLLPSLHAQVRRGYVEIWTGAHRDLIDIADVVKIADALLRAGARDDVFNVASGRSVGVEEIVAQLEQRLGVFVLRNYVDRGDSYRVCIDKLRGRLGPKLPDFGPDYYRRVIQSYLESEPFIKA